LIYDRPDWAVRLTAGDQLPYSVSFQDAAEIFGLGIGRLLNTFRADRVVTASSGRTITLREPATVTVVVNGVPSRTLQLDAGVYDLSDLPLTAGANAVQLVVEDAAGGRRVVSFDFFQDYELLAPGVDEFNVHLGIRSRFLDGYRRYFKDEPAVSGFYRRGITPQLTLGVNAQATKAAQQLGLEATLGTPVGLFTLESAFSQIDGVGSGHALRLQYRYSTPLQQLQGARRVDVQIEQRSRSFGSIENVLPINDIKWRLSGRYSQPISDVLDAGLGVDFNDSRTAGRDSYAVRGTIGWQFRPDATVNLFGGYEKREGFNFGLNLLMRLGRNSIATAQYESASNQGALTYTHSPERLLDTLAYSAQLTRTRDNVGVNALASYRTNRGDFEVTHRASYGTRANEIVSQVTSLRYQGSVAFTGGRFAVGRFLYDSFAIVSAHPSLKGAPVLVGNRDADYVEARTGALGPALVSLSSYSRRNIFFDVPDAPQGYDLGAGNFQVYPWYHSGFELTVGSEFNVTVVGTLVDERGDPVALTSGIARRVNDPNSPAVAIYTNRSGKLGASGLAPGRWRISAGGLAYEMVIEEAQGTFVNLQTLRPTGRQENSR
jgi:outer membrane usher protein